MGFSSVMNSSRGMMLNWTPPIWHFFTPMVLVSCTVVVQELSCIFSRNLGYICADRKRLVRSSWVCLGYTTVICERLYLYLGKCQMKGKKFISVLTEAKLFVFSRAQNKANPKAEWGKQMEGKGSSVQEKKWE